MEQTPDLTIHGITISPIKRSQSTEQPKRKIYPDITIKRPSRDKKEWQTLVPTQITRRFRFDFNVSLKSLHLDCTEPHL